jgi:phosphatidylserine decarboxylase
MIVKEGWKFVLGFSGIGVLLIGLTPWVGRWIFWIGLVLLLMGCFSLYFFRNPERAVITDERKIISPADGVVMEVVDYTSASGEQQKIIRIFLSIFNVHIQRFPVSGTVERIEYHTGKFLAAMDKRAAFENEQNTVILKTARGTVAVSQIAGLIARRIVCWTAQGQPAVMGMRYGLICFGSQVDVAVPASARITVQKGDQVRAGLTVMGEWL